jgi:hypothetical protein
MSTYRGYEACSKALNKILKDSREKLKNTTQETLAQVVLEVSESLVDFTSSSEPKDFTNWDEIEQIEQLDQLADNARHSITADSIESSVKALMDSTSQLNQLVKKLKSETEKNNQKAKEIRLKPIITVVDSFSSLVEELQKAKASLSKDGEEADIAKQADSLIKAFNNLEKALKEV